MSDPIRYWQTLTTVEATALASRDPVVVLPLTAIEQHGPHLPLSTDLEIGVGLLREAFSQLPNDLPAWVLPAQTIGASREHLRFAGTLSLDPDLLTETITQQGAAVAACGVRRLVLFNSHGGNVPLMDAAALRLRDEHGMLVVKATYATFSRPGDITLPESEWRHGLHGGTIETAMMLHLRPDLVRTGALQHFASLGQDLDGPMRRLGPEGEASFAWLAGDLNTQGVTGDARLADADTGLRLVAHYGRVLADVIQDARAFPLDRLA
jgi:creatinine amidohydrolase